MRIEIKALKNTFLRQVSTDCHEILFYLYLCACRLSRTESIFSLPYLVFTPQVREFGGLLKNHFYCSVLSISAYYITYYNILIK